MGKPELYFTRNSGCKKLKELLHAQYEVFVSSFDVGRSSVNVSKQLKRNSNSCCMRSTGYLFFHSMLDVRCSMLDIHLLRRSSFKGRGTVELFTKPSTIGYRTVGKEIENVAPTPTLLSTSMVPLCSNTTCLTIDRPSPVPPSRRDRDLSTT